MSFDEEMDELVADALREATDSQIRDENYNAFSEGGALEGLVLDDESYELDEYDLEEY